MKHAPWFTYPTLLFPKRILANLDARIRAGLTPNPPNAWQLSLGVMRMWHRSLFRSETIGTSPNGTIRDNWRARILFYRPARFPFLAKESAIAPFDLTGLASSPQRIIKHLLGAHHDGNQFIFDLELLSAHDGALEELAQQARKIAQGSDARSLWMRDLTVFEGYHEELLAATEKALQNGIDLSPEELLDADMSLAAYLNWCTQQPETPAATWQAIWQGKFSFHKAPEQVQ